MNILANENVPRPLVERLRRDGHDVVWVVELSAGAKDRLVALRAEHEGRILLTFDKDFGNLVFREARIHPAGIVLVRTRMQSRDTLVDRLALALAQDIEWEGYFSVLTDSGIRSLPMPSRRSPS